MSPIAPSAISLPGELAGRGADVVEADHVGRAAGLGRFDHGAAVVQRAPSGFSQNTGLPSAKAASAMARWVDLRRGDHHRLDLRVGNQRLPVGAARRSRKRAVAFGLSASLRDHFEPRPQAGVEHRADSRHRHRMGLAHVAAADDSDADLSHISLCFEIQFATGCKISILGIGVSQAAFWEPEAIRRICRCQREVTALMNDGTVRLTTAQAIIRYLANQFIEIDGEEMRLCGGGFGIFGHGNVTCLGEALDHRAELPLYRGQNEQSMGFAAAGYAKQWLRQRFMFCTASAGPGHGQPADIGGAGACQPAADADAVRRHLPHPAARPGAAAA
jgi:hypothetical protein